MPLVLHDVCPAQEMRMFVRPAHTNLAQHRVTHAKDFAEYSFSQSLLSRNAYLSRYRQDPAAAVLKGTDRHA